MKKGLLIVFSSPSGGGKGSILKELFERNGELRYSVSATTRAPRPGETDGKEYYFKSREEFEELIRDGKMLEYTEYCGNYYGTPKSAVEGWLEEGHDVVLEIEVDGGEQIKKQAPECVSVFILPPSMEVLEKRLRRRGTEDEETLRKRLKTARNEIPCAKEYDYVVINGELEEAVSDVEAIVRAEKLRLARNPGIAENILNSQQGFS